MLDRQALERRLPSNAKLIIADIARTVPKFFQALSTPVGFVSIDVDYYWSTVETLRIFDGPADLYLPMVPMYLDDAVRVDRPRCCVSNYYFSPDLPEGHEHFHIPRLYCADGTKVRRVVAAVDSHARAAVRKLIRLGLGKQDIYAK